LAIAPSYAAVCANTFAASSKRVAGDTSPAVRISSSTRE
jgi:hypothetical protein